MIIGQLYYNIKAVYIQFGSVERKLSMLRVGIEREIKIWCTNILLIIALIKSCVTTNNRQPIDRPIYDAHEYYNRYWNLTSECVMLRGRPWPVISDQLPPRVLTLYSSTTSNKLLYYLVAGRYNIII